LVRPLHLQETSEEVNVKRKEVRKVAAIRAALGLFRLACPDLLASLDAMVQGMDGNVNFPSPPVDIATLKALRISYAAALTNSLDGGRKAMIERNKQREVVIHAMQQIAKYVELHCQNDMGIFLSSGLKPASSSKAPQPLDQPTVRKVDHGIAGQLLVRVKPVGASSYELRWGVSVNGASPTSWASTGFTNTRSPIAVNNLTPGTTYAFQVRALGPLGYTEYSDSVSRMAN
jgi:hypothetical protein